MKRYLLAALVALTMGAASADTTLPLRGHVFTPSDPHIQYVGRISFLNPERPQFNYPGTQINVGFEGTELRMLCKPKSGYWMAQQPTRIATVAIGYGDGYLRGGYNKGFLFIRGQLCPILGRVCMDATMVDVSHIPDVQVGETVDVVNGELDHRISMESVPPHHSLRIHKPCGPPPVPQVLLEEPPGTLGLPASGIRRQGIQGIPAAVKKV